MSTTPVITTAFTAIKPITVPISGVGVELTYEITEKIPTINAPVMGHPTRTTHPSSQRSRRGPSWPQLAPEVKRCDDG
jgi:hypothetical protein